MIKKVIKRINEKISRVWFFDFRELYKSFYHYNVVDKTEPASKSVLIIELNKFHGEVLLGYAYYFKQLGYDVTFIVRRSHIKEKVFARDQSSVVSRIIPLSPLFTSYLIGHRWLSNFNVIFFTSSRYIEKYGTYDYVHNYLKWPKHIFSRAFFIEHNYISSKDSFKDGKLNPKRCFSLSGVKYDDISLPMVNPSYFGQRANRLKKNSFHTFITIGAIDNRNRNFDLLCSAIEELRAEGHKKFQVKVIGRFTESHFSKIQDENIKLLGYLPFDDMYNEIESADYFLPLLDPKVKEHQRYLSGETTGSRQLILGFRKPAIINILFANAYDFNEGNAILYKGEQLGKAMIRAISQDQNEYKQMTSMLEKLANEVSAKSKSNLAHAIKRELES